jgi:hypothetical protein
MSQPVFISVGRTFNAQQEAFVAAVETYLRAQGFEPRTVGRNYFRNDQPLKVATDSMKECVGVIVIAFERIHVDKGAERRGASDESDLSGVNFPTVWNQIEAALAYATHRPLLVLVENGLKLEGLLQTGYDWWVQQVTLDPSFLLSSEFMQVFSDWKTHSMEAVNAPASSSSTVSAADLSIKDLLGSLKVAQLWGLLAALFGLMALIAATAFKLGHSH